MNIKNKTKQNEVHVHLQVFSMLFLEAGKNPTVIQWRIRQNFHWYSMELKNPTVIHGIRINFHRYSMELSKRVHCFINGI